MELREEKPAGARNSLRVIEARRVLVILHMVCLAVVFRAVSAA